ncbi:MAG: ATP-binding protein, partial [Actinomycetota bacterium]|nr:ATP-binding protein [Actinomycetota bacterium]
GLRDEVLDLAREARRALGFDPHVTFGGPVDAMVPDSVSVEVVPVVREALSNAAKHAAASRLDIDLRVADGALRLEVADNGRGLPTTDNGAGGDGTAGRRWEGQGLGNLAERAGRLGGTCTIRSDPGHGTTVVWTVPVDDRH